jgi:hypothetical protein
MWEVRSQLSATTIWDRPPNREVSQLLHVVKEVVDHAMTKLTQVGPVLRIERPIHLIDIVTIVQCLAFRGKVN